MPDEIPEGRVIDWETTAIAAQQYWQKNVKPFADILDVIATVGERVHWLAEAEQKKAHLEAELVRLGGEAQAAREEVQRQVDAVAEAARLAKEAETKGQQHAAAVQATIRTNQKRADDYVAALDQEMQERRHRAEAEHAQHVA